MAAQLMRAILCRIHVIKALAITGAIAIASSSVIDVQ